MKRGSVKIEGRPKVRYLAPSNRDRVIRPLKGGGYRRKGRAANRRDEE